LAASQFVLSAAVALAVCDFLTKKLETDVTIKWPNDLYWRDRKAGGILIETVLQGSDWKFAVVGIGLNLNQTNFPVELGRAVSVKQVTGKDSDIIMSARELCAFVEKRWTQLVSGDAVGILSAYNQSLYKKNQRVQLRKSNIRFETVIREVSKEGELVTQNGGEERFRVGEVELLID